jgi:hypothetical protein
VILKGLAEIAGVPTPAIDTVLAWAQGIIGKEYMVDGKVGHSTVVCSVVVLY